MLNMQCCCYLASRTFFGWKIVPVTCRNAVSKQNYLFNTGECMENNNERLLVVGGGGARGAWGAGFAKYLAVQQQQPYRYVFGTSTGSLMAPMIVLNDFDTLKKIYTSVTQDAIFDVNPFNKDGSLKTLNALWRLARGKQTFGESHNLRDLIARFLTPDRYASIINGTRTGFTVCTLNYRTGELLYKAAAASIPYEEMVSWIWASANEPLFMSFADTPYLQGGPYVDGGIRRNVPVLEALSYAKQEGISHIDIIVNKPIDPLINKTFQPAGILQNLLRVIEFWETEVRNSNILLAKLLDKLNETSLPPVGLAAAGKEEDALFNLNFHFIPADLYAANVNELVFDQQRMTDMWNAGEQGQEDKSSMRSYRVMEEHLQDIQL